MSTRVGLVARRALIVLVVVGLAVDAFVHLDLASAFAENRTGALSETDLFRAEAVVAIVAAVALLVRPRRYTAAFAFVVAAAGTVAVVLYRYVDIGAFGPIPGMYDPFWAPPSKTLSAVAEGVAALAALALFLTFQREAQDRAACTGAGPEQGSSPTDVNS